MEENQATMQLSITAGQRKNLLSLITENPHGLEDILDQLKAFSEK
jgi:predicted transcriptional regulator